MTPEHHHQHARLTAALWDALAVGDGLPLRLVLDAVLLLAASVALNAGLSPRHAAFGMLQRMAALRSTPDPGPEADTSWSTGPVGEA